jgi:isopenicillin-N N-acyltransferase-like protein
MNRRTLIKGLAATATLPLLSGCGFWRIDKWHYLVRSDIIKNAAQEREIVSKAKLTWSEDGKVRILYVRGTPYERGYQHGALLQQEVEDNIGYLYKQALKKFPVPELFDEVYERMSPFIPQAYKDEMRGLAHGARVPLRMIQHIHILPDIGEWGGKKHIVNVIKSMMRGDDLDLWGTSCSNFAVKGSSSADGGFYPVRILDWGLHRISRLHEYPLINVSFPEDGVPNANIGWVGFLGAVSGMNAQGITLGEMGYGNPEGEVLSGIPLCFMLREVLTHAKKLEDARAIIRDSVGTSSYVFLIGDGKVQRSEFYIKDRNRFLVFKEGERIEDTLTLKDKHGEPKYKKTSIDPIENIQYGGHYLDKMKELLTLNKGRLTPEVITKEIIPNIGMPSNFQNVVYDPVRLEFWVSNAADTSSRAAEGEYTRVSLKEAFAGR